VRGFLLVTLLGVLAGALALAGRWLWISASVGTGYAAKVACSLVLNSGQDPEHVLEDYVVHEVDPLGAVLRLGVSERSATASALGIVHARAVFRPGLGCTLLSGADEAELARVPALEEELPALDPRLPWPLGDSGVATREDRPVYEAIDRAFREIDPALGLRRTTAVVVVHDGRLVGEGYAPTYRADLPMLSWSMAKSVLAALVGIAVAEGRLALDAPAPVPEWSDPGDPRHAITLDQLLRASSGLAFDEHYGTTNDVSRMLFTEPDTGAFAARSPLAAPPDTVWSYSSGTSNLIARMLRDAFGRDLAAMVRWSRERLFEPAGLTSAFLEPDASGTFVASSFAFMTARDWARFGELHRQDGLWNGRRVLPEGWVRYVTTPTPAAPEGIYGAHWWLNAGDPQDPARRMWPRVPRGAYAARGHSGQYVVIVPSAKLVVVRLGLSTCDEAHQGIEDLVAELVGLYGEEGDLR
jgi:CubicO group peptidase (beta-lactamase class C family)